MIHASYLAVLMTVIVCLGLVDYRYKLAYFYNRAATIKTVTLAALLFAAWDILGIKLGIFFTGRTNYLLGLTLLPNFPIEEVFFLVLLAYNTLLVWRGVEKSRPKT